MDKKVIDATNTVTDEIKASQKFLTARLDSSDKYMTDLVVDATKYNKSYHDERSMPAWHFLIALALAVGLGLYNMSWINGMIEVDSGGNPVVEEANVKRQKGALPLNISLSGGGGLAYVGLAESYYKRRRRG